MYTARIEPRNIVDKTAEEPSEAGAEAEDHEKIAVDLAKRPLSHIVPYTTVSSRLNRTRISFRTAGAPSKVRSRRAPCAAILHYINAVWHQEFMPQTERARSTFLKYSGGKVNGTSTVDQRAIARFALRPPERAVATGQRGCCSGVFRRSAAAALPRSRARRYQDAARPGSPGLPRTPVRLRKLGSNVAPSRRAAAASPPSAARS
jgi:hypothetical protein